MTMAELVDAGHFKWSAEIRTACGFESHWSQICRCGVTGSHASLRN